MDIKSVLWQLKKEREREDVYQNLRSKCKILKQFKTFNDLKNFLHNKNSTDYTLKDNIILAFLSEYQTTQYKNILSPFIILIFEPALKNIFYLYKKRLPSYPELNSSDLASLTLSFFLEELNQPLPDQKVFSKITGRVKNKVRKYFYNLLLEEKAKKEYQKEPEVEEIDSAPIKEKFINLLNQLENQKIITPTQKHILLASIIYNQPLKQIAKTLNLSYEDVRQKKSRGMRKMRRWL
jgi:DNA-binding CsgD family transcriptional regulator